MVTNKNVVHAALYLLVVLSAVAGVYIILGAEFAAATQVLVYLGAIMVLLLFGVMLTRATLGKEYDLDHERRWIGGLVAAAMMAVMSYSIWSRSTSRSSSTRPCSPSGPSRCPTRSSAPTSSRSKRSRCCCWRPSSAQWSWPGGIKG